MANRLKNFGSVPPAGVTTADIINTLGGTLLADVVAVGNITLSGEQIIDSITTNGSRVLCVGQTDQKGNGLYISSPSAWTRATYFDTDTEIRQKFVSIQQGTTYAGALYQNTNTSAITIGATNITFARRNFENTVIPVSANVLASNASKEAIQASLTGGSIWQGNGSNLPAEVAIPVSATLLGSTAGRVIQTASLTNNKFWSGNSSNLPIETTVTQKTPIGLGETHTTIASAVAAAKYRLILTSNITETASINGAYTLDIDCNGYAIDNATNKVAWTVTKLNLYNGTITTNNDLTDITGILLFDQLTYTATNTALPVSIIFDMKSGSIIKNTTINFASVNKYLYAGGIFEDVKFVGSGASCYPYILTYNDTLTLKNCKATGIFSTSAVIETRNYSMIVDNYQDTSTNKLSIGIDKQLLTISNSTCNLKFNISATKLPTIQNSTVAITTNSNVATVTNSGLFINSIITWTFTGTNSFLLAANQFCQFSNCNISIVNSKAGGADAIFTGALFDNCVFVTAIPIAYITMTNAQFSNCKFLVAQILSYDYLQFSNCNFSSTITSNNDYIKVGGIVTGLITLAATAEYNDFSHCTMLAGYTTNSSTTNIFKDNQ
jgi:hypothetical protein